MRDFVLILLVMGGFVAIFAVAAIWGRRREKRRAEELRAVGSALGLTYFPKADPAWLSTLSWREKLGFTCNNTLYGQTDDLTIRVFDHFYTTGVGPLSFPRRQTMVGCASWALNDLPDFSLRPDTALYHFASLFGCKRIEFDSHPSFSRAFLLRAIDEAGVRQVFDDEVLAFFEQAPDVCVELDGQWLLFYRKGVLVKPTELCSFFGEGLAVYRLLRFRTSVSV